MLEVRNVKKACCTGNRQIIALNNTSFKTDLNGLYFILGDKGMGASTLIRMIAGLESPSEGDIFYNGKRIDFELVSDLKKYRQDEVSYIFHAANLLGDLSVYENLRLVGSNLDIVAILDFLNFKKPHRVKVKRLTYLERLNIAIARSFIMNTKVILFNDPTRYLGRNDTVLFCELVKRLSKFKIILIATSDKAISNQYGDRVFIIKEDEQSQEVYPDNHNQMVVKVYEDYKPVVYRVHRFLEGPDDIVFKVLLLGTNQVKEICCDQNSLFVTVRKIIRDYIGNELVFINLNSRNKAVVDEACLFHPHNSNHVFDLKFQLKYAYTLFIEKRKNMKVTCRLLPLALLKVFILLQIISNRERLSHQVDLYMLYFLLIFSIGFVMTSIHTHLQYFLKYKSNEITVLKSIGIKRYRIMSVLIIHNGFEILLSFGLAILLGTIVLRGMIALDLLGNGSLTLPLSCYINQLIGLSIVTFFITLYHSGKIDQLDVPLVELTNPS